MPSDLLSGSAASARKLAFGDGLIWSILLLSPLAVGTVHVVPWAVAAGVALTAFGVALRATPYPPRIPKIVLAIGGLWGLGLLFHQLPLPEGLVRLISPEAAAAWALGSPTSGGGTDLRLIRIHRSPGTGAFQVLRWVAASAFAGACFVRAADRTWRRRLPVVVLASVVVASVVCLVQTAAGSDALLGLYVPRAGFGDIWRAPLINPNHWSAYLSMGALVGLGLALRADGDRLRGLALLYGFAALLLVAQVCFASSRGGLIGLGTGSAALVLLVFSSKRGTWGHRAARIHPVALGAAVLLLAAVFWGVVDRTDTRLDPYSGKEFGGIAEESRVALLPVARAVLSDHGASGVGRGGLYDVFPNYRDLQGVALSRWMEVLPVDLLLDFGWFLGGLLLFALSVMLVLALREGRRGPTRAGAAAGVLGLAIHEMGDFATEGGAVLFVAVALSTLVLSVRDRNDGRASQVGLPSLEEGGATARRTWLLVLLTLLLLLPLARGASKHYDVSRCLDRMTASAQEGVSWRELGSAEWSHHPSSFPLALGVAFGAGREADVPTSLSWLNRAQVLAPYHPGPHLWTARLLRLIGAEGQALVEYRLAMEGAWRSQARDIFREVARAYPLESDLRRLVPTDRPEAIAQFSMWLRDLGDKRSSAFGREAMAQLDESPATLMAGIYAHLDGQHWNEARTLIEKAWQRDDLDPNIRLRLAVSMGWSGAEPRSLAMLQEMASGLERSWPSLWFSLGRAEARAGDAPSARRALRRIGSAASPHWRAKALRVEADLAESDGRQAEARRLRDRAQALDGASSPPKHGVSASQGEQDEGAVQ
jgi:hypothetical protein